MDLKVISYEEMQQQLAKVQHKAQEQYLAMYSSWVGGVVLDPRLMLVPIDDHLVHRGDGVFEALKIIDNKVYLLDAHLNRLMHSAQKIGLVSRWTIEQIKSILGQVVKMSGTSQAIVRVFLSRGPGQFSTNPYDSVGSQLYVVVTALNKIAEQKYIDGVKVGRSQVLVKAGWFAQVKSCNYLPNVLMKKEAVDKKLDFTVSFDENGFLAEGSTENMIVLSQNNELMHPFVERILHGTTMARLFSLVEKQALLPVKRGVNLSEGDLKKAQALYMIGTTLDVVRVQRYEDVHFESNELDQKFLQILHDDQTNGMYSIDVNSIT